MSWFDNATPLDSEDMFLHRSKLLASILLASPWLIGNITALHATEHSATFPCAEGCVAQSGDDEDGCCHETFDLQALFHQVAGNEPLLQGWKDQQCGNLTYSVGGAVRYRFMNEANRLRPGGPAASDYNLWRFNPSLSLNYNDKIRGFAEAIDASAFGYQPPLFPLGIDVNRTDLLRYYVELNLGEIGDGSLTYRYGRQYLNYGSQYLLSPLAWANTFRNFQGHKLQYTGSNWNVDGFHMDSVNLASGGSGGGFTAFDTPDSSRTISGVYATYKGMANNEVDLYWLYFDDTDGQTNRMDGKRHTIGARVAGSTAVKECDKVVGTWSWQAEGAYQFGEDQFGSPALRDVQAGMVNANIGYTFNELPWSPGINGIFYWGSGDNDPDTGDINTYYSLYSLGHAYWGQIDNLGGQNLLDFGVQGTVKPHEKLTVATQWHYFALPDSGDNIYNVAGAPIAGTGASDVGQEVDIVATVPVTKTFNVQAGYFWFFYGDAVPINADATQFYLQTIWNF